MLWEVEIRPIGRDAEREHVCQEFNLLVHAQRAEELICSTARGYWLEGDIGPEALSRLVREVLVDPVVEEGIVGPVGTDLDHALTVTYKPGVMDPVAQTVLETARRLGWTIDAVRTFRRYYLRTTLTPEDRALLVNKVLANDAIEQVLEGALPMRHLSLGSAYRFQLVHVPLRDLDAEGLLRVSREGMLALSLEEMQVIQAHFRQLGREPTDCELETIAQTWSEHCSHKTLKGTITLRDGFDGSSRTYRHLLRETIFAATAEIRQRLGAEDWCVSVFEDNAGVIQWEPRYHLCFKVETHNHPSALEPYGGANTGVGGVIRDVLGTGCGAKPIANTDVFCFAPPDYPAELLPEGVLHPRRVLQGVVAGVRDYGNRMGIPTVNGAIVFDPRYLANPLVYCGTVGLLPVDRSTKSVSAGDWIVVIGGRTGRDGIHGATFSSLELTHESETVSGGAVQIGNAITEKKLLDVLLQARDRGLFRAVTDCGAGGFSSAIGEMAAGLGATVRLEAAPLKYTGLSYTEIWISESQERMILAVPPEKWPELQALCAAEDVEAAVLGQFEASGRLKLTYEGHVVADLDIRFLHEGRPTVVREAVWPPPSHLSHRDNGAISGDGPPESASPVPMTEQEALLRLLGHYTVASKEWVIRQYDHEVQGGSVIKPLVGAENDGPSDAAVLRPLADSWLGVAIGCGINPLYGEWDPYAMAALAIDEAVRNVVAVGADPRRIALLDNFCWGNVHDPVVLGALVRAAEACRDVAIAYGTPFISGKDSLHNTYRGPDGTRHDIPHTLLISAIGRIADVRRCVTMDLKGPGHLLILVGESRAELGGSLYYQITRQRGGRIPQVNTQQAPRLFSAIHEAITHGWVQACHDLSEGGLAVAIAEMAFAGNVGADVRFLPGEGSNAERLFGESPSRFLLEVAPEHRDAVASLLQDLPWVEIGITVPEPRLRLAGTNGQWCIWASLQELKQTWQKPLWSSLQPS
jgi:phosphoribosylformylglycinamidine synthase